MVKKINVLTLCLMFLFMTGLANAALITGDFRTESDLPYQSDLGPLVHENIAAAIGAGFELTDADFVENPSDWGGGVVFMDYNPLTNRLILNSQDEWDFQTFDAYIYNIAFDGLDAITGLSMISNNLTTPTIIPTLSFTSNSIHISYDYSDTFNFTAGIAEFQITTSTGAPVPEPATMLLFGIGLIGLAGVNRKK